MTKVDIKPISKELLAQLMRVPASTNGYMEYRPCLVEFDDGSWFPRVYVVEVGAYMKVWGVLPGDDPAKQSFQIERVKRIEDSPERLTAEHANAIYKAGESGMGYVIFTIVLKDGRRLPYVTGNAVDFPNWPTGVTPAMVASVESHHGREYFRNHPPQADERSADYAWCLYTIGRLTGI